MSRLTYNDYLVLVAMLDESSSFRTRMPEQQLFREVSSRFNAACSNYRRVLQANCAAYKGVAFTPSDTELDETLYNPIRYMTFGRTDYAAIALLDGFNAALSITMDVRSPVESLSVGFCPQIESLGLSVAETHWLTTFPDLLRTTGLEVADERASDYVHPFQRQTPLVALTNLRMNGGVILGEGLAFSRAIYRAIATRINQTLTAMGKHSQCPAGPVVRLVEREDIERFRYCLIEPQGADDILLFMACTNYSVAVTVISAIRELTVADILRADETLWPRIAYRPGHDAIFRMCQLSGWKPDLPALQSQWEECGDKAGRQLHDSETLGELLLGNHVFARTVTTLGASFEAFESPKPHSSIHGFIEPTINLDISCGHSGEVQRTLLTSLQSFVQKHLSGELSVPLGLYTSCAHFAIGAHDHVFVPPLQVVADRPLEEVPRHFFSYGMPTATYITAVRHLERAWCEQVGDSDHGPAETGLLDLSSSLSVPFKILRIEGNSVHTPRINNRLHAPLQAGLRWLRNRLCPDFEEFAGENFGDMRQTVRANHEILFNLSLLDRQMRKLEVPRVLRRTITFLFHDFLTALSDTEAFHAVVDLYDMYASLYNLLTSSLPRAQARLADTVERRMFFNRHMIDDLAEIVRAIQCAVAHRVTTTRYQDDVRSADVVFRGGLNKIMAVIDVPLKCGLGMIRRLSQASPSAKTVRYHEMGAVALLASHSKTQCRRAMFIGGALNTPFFPCLAHIEMNVARIFSPAQYINIIHEATHIVRRSILSADNDGIDPGLAECGRIDSCDPQRWIDVSFQTTRQEEMFVGFVLLLLAFSGDYELYTRYHFIEYSGDPVAREATRESMVDAFLEMALQVFVVADAGRERRRLNGPNVRRWSKFHPYAFRTEVLNQNATAAAEQRFRSFLKQFGRYCFYWNMISSSSGFDDRIGQAFRAMWKTIMPGALSDEYERAYHLLDVVIMKTTKEGDIRKINRACREAIKDGTPDVRGRLFEKGIKSPDEIIIVCSLLRLCLRSQYRAVPEGVSLHLVRNFDGPDFTAEAEFREADRPMHVYQVDPSSQYLRCSDPRERRQRCLRDITLMKALWDISTVFRDRRVKTLVDIAQANN